MADRHSESIATPAVGELLSRGRDAFARRAWRDAYAGLLEADEQVNLHAEDLERLALSAYALNLDTEPFRAWTRAHHEWLKLGGAHRAARCAFVQAAALFTRGEMAPAQGWISRGRRIVDEVGDDCPERGWLVLMTGLPFMFSGDNERARPHLQEAEHIAARFQDQELIVTARQALGHVLIQLNDLERGLPLVDESMVAVTAGEIDPLFAGIAYCQLIQTCRDIFDLRRAREWTASLSLWCEAQPDLVPRRGECLVYRTEMLLLMGAWGDAEAAARQACEMLTAQRSWWPLASAHYQMADIFRLRGDYPSAEDHYRRASEYGRDPEPGMSLLCLAQRRFDAARAGIERALAQTTQPAARARLLPAWIEIALADGDVPAAERGAEELSGIAKELDMPLLRASAASARGAVLLARGDAAAALQALRESCREFQEVDAPYESARTRVRIALACRQSGAEDAATQELESARAAFVELGAAADVQRVDALTARPTQRPGGLSQRELEVLALIARGLTNKQISAELVLSENTVARHVQNIFNKLHVSSRAAATAYAFEHKLV